MMRSKLNQSTNNLFQLEGKKIWIAGGTGMVGGATLRRLNSEKCDLISPDREELDLLNQREVESWCATNSPDVVVIAAATVGGIHANSTRPAEFIYNNMVIASNIIHASFLNNVEKLLYLGSACIYPRNATQPISEKELLTGSLEPTNEWYAIAKIAGIKMCQAYKKQYGCNYISAQPNNLYGPVDNFDLLSGHVIPSLIHKAHMAKSNDDDILSVWGTGNVQREFLHVDDCADALVHLLKHYDGMTQINIGTGEEIKINELAELICEIVGFKGNIAFDTSKPDGAPRKLLDHSRMDKLNWGPSISLKDGLRTSYQWFLENK